MDGAVMERTKDAKIVMVESMSNASANDAARALEECNWDVEKAMDLLEGEKKLAGGVTSMNDTSDDKNTAKTTKKVSNKPNFSGHIGKEKDETEERLEYTPVSSGSRQNDGRKEMDKGTPTVSLPERNNIRSHEETESALVGIVRSEDVEAKALDESDGNVDSAIAQLYDKTKEDTPQENLIKDSKSKPSFLHRRKKGDVGGASTAQPVAAANLHELDTVDDTGNKRAVGDAVSDPADAQTVDELSTPPSCNIATGTHKDMSANLHTPSRVYPGAVAVVGPDPPDEIDDDFTTTAPTNPTVSINVAAQGLTRPPGVECGQVAGGDTGLAVAMAIDEDKLPAAIECDPDPKPPLYRNRRFRLCAFLGVVVLIAVVAAVVAAVVTRNDSGSQDPTPAPTTMLELSYRDQFVAEVGNQVNVDGTPYDRAAEWIMFEDPARLPPDAPNLIQRYQLALLWFLTTRNGEKPWNSCNPPMEDVTERCTFLDTEFNDAFVEYTVYGNISNQVRWMASTHECEWVGTFCDPARNLIALQVSGQNITGTLPTEISTLPYLEAIALYHNEFTGTIPEVYADMKQLISLELQYNYLTGTVPDVYWRANGLQHLNLGSNILSGTISTEVGTLNQMKGIFLFDNKFLGTIPSEIGNLGFLSYVRLNKNGLVGEVPTEMGNLSLLRELWLWENGIEGQIPSELGLMKDMENMEIYENQFTGTIPEEIYDLKQMYSFDVNLCRLTGTLSTRIGQLTKMERFRVSSNDLTGTIPEETANLTSIALFWFHKTLFTGTVPESLCRYRPTPLEILQADCNPPQNPSVPCLCCSHCCNREDKVCLSTDN